MFTCTWTTASAAVPRTAYTSRTACDASSTIGGATHCSTARYPSTWIEYCPPDSVRSPLSSLWVRLIAAVVLFPTSLVTNSSAHPTRTTGSRSEEHTSELQSLSH